MKVSIIMTSWNTAEYIDQAVLSILHSTYSELELVIVDDGSTDDTPLRLASLASQDPRIVVELGPHVGRRRALEQAHSLATGDVLAWVDSDDVLHPRALERCTPVIRSGADLVYTHRRLLDAAGNDRGPHAKNVTPYDPLQLLVSNMIFHLRLYRRDLFERAGGVGDLESAIDWDLNLRMTELADPVCIPEELYWYRVRPGRMSGTTAQASNGRLAVLRAIRRRGLDVELVIDDRGWHLRRR